MSLLTDRDVLKYIADGSLRIDPVPYDDIRHKLRGCSVNLYLSDRYYVPEKDALGDNDIYDIQVEQRWKAKDSTNTYMLNVGKTVTAETLERIELPSNIGGIYKTRFKYASMGLFADGIIHPGSKGRQMLVIHNLGEVDFPLRKGKSICQLLLFKTEHPCMDWYGELNFNKS